MALYTTSGTIPPGLNEIEFIFSADFTGTVGGVAFDGAVDYSLPFSSSQPDGLSKISFVVTTGSVRVKTS